MAAQLWTEEEDACLRELAAEGRSASQIATAMAERFGRCFTRNSVVSRLTRHPELGKLQNQPGGAHKARKCKPRSTPVIVQLSKTPIAVAHAPTNDFEIPPKQRRSLMQLRKDQCRWPVGEPGTPGFFFCAADALPGWSYCAAHCARAYRTPAQAKEERQREMRKAA